MTSDQTVREDVRLKTTCYGCTAGTCGMIVRRVNGVVVEIAGDPDCPFSQGKLCAKGHAQIMMTYSTRRVVSALKRTNPEKGLGVDPKWVEISYEEAIKIAGAQLRKCRDIDPTKLVYSSADFTTFPWNLGSTLASFGTPNFITGGLAWCGNNVHATVQQVHGAFHVGPDFNHCNYLMLIGSNKGAMGNWSALSGTLEMSRARRRGMKVIVVDPRCSNAGAIADEWVPIRPGTDCAFVLSMINVMINEIGLYDRAFLQKLSNAPYLVRSSDGRYAREPASNKPMLWDSSEDKAKCYDDPSLVSPALEGQFEVADELCMPAFQALKQHLEDYTPERVEAITTVPAATIRRLAREFSTAAAIGSTIDIEGHMLPLRPACAHWYKGLSQHSRSLETGLAMALLNSVVGAIDVPGGLLGDTVYAHHPQFSENNTWMGKGSGLFDVEGILVPGRFNTYADAFPSPYPPKKVNAPISMTADSLGPASLYMSPMLAKLNSLNPKRFKDAIPHDPKIFVQALSGNDLLNEGNPKVQAEYLKLFEFQISIVPIVDETTEFADIVFPTQTSLERLDFGANNIPDTMGSTATSEYCINLRQPVIDLGNRHFVDVWIDLAEEAGFLDDYNRNVNLFMELHGDFQLEPGRKYTHRELTERWIGSMSGGQLSLADVAKEGRLRWRKSAQERYPRAFYTARLPIYYEYMIGLGEQVKAVTQGMGVEWDVSRYRPLPAWRQAPAHEERREGFDLYGVNYKQPHKTGSFSNFNAWLGELSQFDRLTGKIVLNRRYAESKNILDGDRVRVENLGGRTVEGVAVLSECIHPECVGMDHAGGNWARSLPPRHRGRTGVHYGELLDYDLKNIDLLNGAVEASPLLKVSLVARA